MTTISQDFNTQQSVPDDGDTLTVAKGVNGIVNDTVINASTVADNRQVIVKGHLEANGDNSPDAINLGLFSDAAGSTGNVITVTETGSLKAADSGIEVYAAGTQITNDGSIKGTYGIYGSLAGGMVVNNGAITASDTVGEFFDGSMQFENAGTLKSSGGYALRFHGDLNSAINTGSIIATKGMAVYFQSNPGEMNLLENKGSISGASIAFQGGAGDEMVKNYGTMSGDVVLGDGENSFILKRGSVDGIVYGGVDADAYTINAGMLQISEAKGGSAQDHVYSSVDITLARNVELLTLKGGDAIDGNGNGSDNSIFGNRQNNVIKGGKGDDYLDADAGKDVLAGGAGADTFYFDDGYGKDTITDFEDGTDKIAPYNHSATPDFNSLKQHMEQVGSDVVIDFGGGDVLTIDNIKLNQLSKNDFLEL